MHDLSSYLLPFVFFLFFQDKIIPRISFLDIFIRGTFFILQIGLSTSLMESLLREPHSPVLQYLPLTAFDVCVFISSSLLITLLYHLIRQISDKSRKSYAWIVMLVSSPVLAVFGVYYTVLTQVNDAWTDEFVYGQDLLSRSVMMFFMASNFTDLILGAFFYAEFLDPFTTIFHHLAYMLFVICLLREGIARGLVICFVMEIPTFILALGTVFKAYRADLLFGVSFALTRLFFNLFLILKLANITNYEGYIWRICSLVLCVHMFWFYKWSSNYGAKLLREKHL